MGVEEAVVITVDFSGLGDDVFEFLLDDWTVASDPDALLPEFKNNIKPVIISNLKATSTTLQVSPTLIHGSGFFTAQSYVFPGGGIFLGVAVNDSNVERDPPETIASFPYDISVEIPAETVKASITQKHLNIGLDPASLPLPLPGEPDMTVNALSIKLRDVLLKVTGDVDDVEFSARLDLKGTGKGLETVVKSVDLDLPWYLDILDAFGGAITRAMEEELPKALADLSKTVVGLDIFADSLPNPSIPGNPVTIKVGLGAGVTIRTYGLILQLSIQREAELVGHSMQDIGLDSGPADDLVSEIGADRSDTFGQIS